MSVIMRFGARRAILCGSRWTAADPALENTLNDATRQWLQETGGPPFEDADPDFTTAMVIGISHGGRIHRHLPSDKPATRNAYVNARQMNLF